MMPVTPSIKLRWLSRVRCDSSLTPTARLVAGIYEERANKYGKSWIGKTRIAKLLGVSEKTVQRATRALVARRYIRITPRLGSTNVGEILFAAEDMGIHPKYKQQDTAEPPRDKTGQDEGQNASGRVVSGDHQIYMNPIKIEPSLSLPSPVQRGSDASAMKARVATLRKRIGAVKFDRWLGEATFVDGDPVHIIAAKSFAAKFVEQKFRHHIEAVFGDGFTVTSREEGALQKPQRQPTAQSSQTAVPSKDASEALPTNPSRTYDSKGGAA